VLTNRSIAGTIRLQVNRRVRAVDDPQPRRRSPSQPILLLGSSIGRACGCKGVYDHEARQENICHSEVCSGLQLQRETAVEKSGEFREAPGLYRVILSEAR